MNKPETIRVYFATQARIAQVERGAQVLDYVRRLKCDEGTYLATTRADYLALRPFEYSPPHAYGPGPRRRR